MSIKLYGSRGGSGLRCHWVLHELGMEYEAVNVDMQNKEHKSEAFLKINPAGQVPALDNNGFYLAESLAINAYLIDLAKSDLGGATPEERAKAWQWSLWTSLNPHPQLATLAMPKWGYPIDEAAAAAAKEKLSKQLPLLEAHLSESPYIAGDKFTVGDINVATAMSYADYSGYDLSSYPKLQAWLKLVTARPAYIAAKG